MTYESKTANKAGLDQLEKVATEFDTWRSQKKHKNEKIPGSLLREAQKLTQHLEVKAVRQRLGITKGQMDKVNALKQVEATSTSDFLQLVPASGESALQHPSLTIDICTADGIKISLAGLSQKDPLALVAKLIEG